MPRGGGMSVSIKWMEKVGAALGLVKGLLRSQERTGGDYDELYFGLQDLETILQEDQPKKWPYKYDRKASPTRKRGGKRTRKLSKWQQFVKKNSKFPRFKYKSGKKKGMINLKALGVAYRKKKR